MVVIEVDVISDIVCVWCYVGKRTLDKAISIHQKTYPNGKNDSFHITWRPYYLGYNAGPQSIDKSEASKIKFANTSPEKVERMRSRMNQIGKSVGIDFKYGGKIGHTRDAHRLIHFTQVKHVEAQDKIVEGVFHAYHEMEQDITKLDVLGKIAAEAGLDEDEVLENLRTYVTTGVPTFIIQGTYRVDGAQDLQEFIEVFVKIREGESDG